MSDWKDITDVACDEKGPFLVSNNINAVNAFGRPSHVWCVGLIQKADDGSYIAYDGFQKLWGLERYMVIPSPAREAGQ